MNKLDDLNNKVKSFILKYKLIKPHDAIVVGLSGGIDSVCLINILKSFEKEFNLKLIAAHLDHEWRSTSGDDLNFCKELAQNLNIEFASEKASNIKLKKKPKSDSKEELGRLLRRQFFELVLEQYQASSIALGHHFDDQIETFLIRLIRGANISGLSSIKPVNSCYIRPLLEIKKEELIEYIKLNELDYVEDITNDYDIYLRNRIRKYVVPELRDCDERFDTNFSKAIINIQKADNFIESCSQELFDKITYKKDNITYIDRKKFIEFLSGNYNYLEHNIILIWLCSYGVEFTPSSRFFDEILKFIKNSESKKHLIHSKWFLSRDKDYIKINIKI